MDDWNANERWVLECVARGETADFNHRCRTPLIPAEDRAGEDRRLVRASLVQALLFDDTMRRSVPRQGLAMIGARIDGDLELEEAKLPFVFGLMDCRIAGRVNLSGVASARSVLLTGSRIAGSLLLNYGVFGVQLALNDAVVSGGDVSMVHTHLKGSATLTGIEVAGSVNALELLADGQLFIDRARIGDEIRMDHASIRSNLFLQGTRLSGLSLSHSRIGGQLYLGSGDHALAWGKHARIDLRNAAARDFRFDPTRWTEARSIDLRGFKYDALTLDETADLGSRRAALIDWLRSTGSPSPQPFQQLAATLQIAGHVEAASDVLYAAREQQRRLSTGIRRIGLSLLCWTTGYGIGARYFRALWWVTALVAAGAITLTIWPAPWPNSSQPLGLVDRVSYSLDVLLPILDLDRRFDAVQLQDPARYYFYLHRALGWALASFVVAGLAGLTKR